MSASLGIQARSPRSCRRSNAKSLSAHRDATSNSVMMPKITNALLGTKFKVVSGYPDSDVTLAMERGEVEGVCGLSYTTLKAARPEWFRDHKINILLQIGLTKFPDLPNVPNAIDLISNPENKRILE